MRAQISIVAAVLFGSLIAGARTARAGDQEYPISFVERPLTLPRMTLAPELELDITHFSIPGLLNTSSTVGVGLAAGATFGITDDFQVNVTLLPLQLAPSPVRYVGPTFGATYRFLKGDVEMGGQFTASFDFGEGNAPAFQTFTPGLPILVHIAKAARLDTGVFFPITHVNSQNFGFGAFSATSPSETYVALSIPLRVAFDVVEPFHVGINTGYSMILNPPGTGTVGETVVVPLGFFAGYAIGEKRPLVDIDPFFQWQDFLTPGAPSGEDKVNPGIWTLGVAARGYIYL